MRRHSADRSRPDPKGGAAGHAETTQRRLPVWSVARWRAWSDAMGARLGRRLADTRSRFPVITRLISRLRSVNILDAATRLAAQTFLTAIPLLFVVASFAPSGMRNQLVSSVRTVFGLTGDADAQLEQILQSHPGTVGQTIGTVGALMVLISATACSRALQRLFRRAWALPSGGAGLAVWRWLAWIVVWLAVVLVQGPLHDGFGAGLWLGVPVTAITLTALWWWTQHLLLAGRVHWLPLLPGAFLTAAALTVLSVSARIYMPHALNRSLQEYGSVGSVFTMLSWLIVVCAAIAVSITVGAVLAQEPWLARHLGPPAPQGRSEAVEADSSPRHPA
ncbi:YihY/virulence factor BrkB family protein [Streptomyces lunaelactis]|uniref:YihY/virulence factor BrkB family protein n=1 Tax=Streptomyces lunaelactis TaxID=1535768 RepID=UPI0020C7988F|nr:YhjD/YihY/BrkB family envelope integrity protein [Streptomyces lunaelactis]